MKHQSSQHDLPSFSLKTSKPSLDSRITNASAVFDFNQHKTISTIQDNGKCHPDNNTLPASKKATKNKCKKTIKTTLSDIEAEKFAELCAKSQMSQADYIRNMVLHGQIHVHQLSITDQETLETLIQISEQLGIIAYSLRQIIAANPQDIVLLDPELHYQLRDLRQLQTSVQRLAEEIYGNL